MPFLHDLREYTQSCHAALERDMDVFHRLTTRDDYRTLLGGYLGFFAPVECQLRKASPAENAGDFQRVERLTRDLRALGMHDETIDGLPRCSPSGMPPLRSAGEIIGCRYVLEGSALGGQIIYRQVQERLGLDEKTGAAFFRGDGEAAGRRWRDFGVELEAFAARASDEERAAARESARATFQSIHAWFCTQPEEEVHA